MADREKVMNALERCESYGYCEDRDCPYYENTNCLELLRKDALTLLKEHEPVKPRVDIDTWVCGNCGARIERQSMIGPNVLISETLDVCPNCRKKVKWE